MDYFNVDSLPLLLPDESYACVFSVSKEIGAPVRCAGSPEIKWCSYMGEHGIVQGADVIVNASTSSQYNNASTGGDTSSPINTTPSGTIPILSPTTSNTTSSVHTIHSASYNTPPPPDNSNINNQGQHVRIHIRIRI